MHTTDVRVIVPIERKTLFTVSAAIVVLVLLLYLPAGSLRPSFRLPPAVLQSRTDALPNRLSDQEFWRMVSEDSERGGYFRSDNFLSNEAGYQHIIPALKGIVQNGGVYVGVGPEQNFTYIVAFEPKMAFIVDIRRQNMLEHLMYKALMELSADRADFLSRLFSRARPSGLDSDSSPESLFDAYDAAPSNGPLFARNVRTVLDHLIKIHGFKLSGEDERRLEYVYRAFFELGPEISYVFLDARAAGLGMPTYSELMTETDGRGRNWSFLATEDQFRSVQRLQKANLIVPLVGDFAGDRAIRAIGRYLKQHSATVSVFYTSNVEQYLFQQGDDWKRFYANVASLPIDANSSFIRYVLNSWGFGFNNPSLRRRSQTVWCPVHDVVNAVNSDRINSYYDVVELSR